MKRFVAILCLVAVLGAAGMAEAGRFTGASEANARVEAFSTKTYTEIFRAGELATVSIVGDGTTDLDIFVYDGFGNLVAQGIGYTDRESVSWVPLTNSVYRIVVRNLGNVWNRYDLRMN